MAKSSAVKRRKAVFFLGAGASVAVGARADVEGGGHLPCPTQSSFWSTFLRFSRGTNNRKTIESFLYRYFLGYQRTPARLSAAERREVLNQVDVEEVFTFLSERIAAPATSPQLRTAANKVWLALVSEMGNVFSRFQADVNTRKKYKLFMERHVRNWDTIVSFNYDTIFEGSIKPYYTTFYEGVQARSNREHRIVKPHGSINWQEVNGALKVRRKPNKCVVVAPTHLKFVVNSQVNPEGDGDTSGYLNQHQAMRDIWACMEAQMKEAKALVFIGYSFPVADLYFSSVLRSILAVRDGQPRIVVVNPDAIAIRARLEARFALRGIRTYFDFDQFNQATRKGILESSPPL